MFVRLNWIDSLFWTSMFIAATSLPFSVWLLKNFIDQVPRELEEAAAIEGTSNLQILVRVVCPLAFARHPRDALVAFINAWGSFVIPLVLNSNPNDLPGAIAIYETMRRRHRALHRRCGTPRDGARGRGLHSRAAPCPATLPMSHRVAPRPCVDIATRSTA